jgi:transketolase
MQTYEDLLATLAEDDPNLVVLTAENRAVIRGLPRRIPGRFIDVGIAEQTMIGVAAGLALRGRTPVTHALATFLTMRAYEFIRTDVGIPGLPVKLVGGVPGFLSEANGPTHQAVEDIALMRSIPGVEIFCPADRQELIEGMAVLLKRPAPLYVRFNDRDPAVDHVQPFAAGRAEELSEGTDVTILTHGLLLGEAAEATRRLASRGLSVGLLNLRMVRPIDEAAISAAARRCRLLVTLEDHRVLGGLYSIVCELLVSRGLSAAVLPLGLEERWFRPALLPDLLAREGFAAAQIAQAIELAVVKKGADHGKRRATSQLTA